MANASVRSAAYDRVQAWALAHVEQLAEEYGSVTLRHGRCRCPIHGGDNPDALSVANGKGWHCFTGDCGSGDGVALVALLTGRERVEVLRELAPRAGVFLNTSSPAPRRIVKSPAVSPPSAPRVKEAPPPTWWETEFAALRAEGVIPASPAVVHTSLSHHLTLGDRGAAYLAGRGLDPNAARAYGFRSLETAAAWTALRTFLAESYLPVEQTMAGVAAIPGAGMAALVLPYHTGDGTGWDGFRLRSLEGKEYRSLKGYTLPLPFNAPAFARADEVHIVEGEMNAYTLHTYGVAALGLDGAKKWRPAWTAALRPVARLVAWYDDDTAGNDGWQKLTERLAEGIGRQWTRDRVRRVRIAKRDGCKDANDLHQRGVLAPLLERAEWRTT